jgi:hypothetical protein
MKLAERKLQINMQRGQGFSAAPIWVAGHKTPLVKKGEYAAHAQRVRN